MWVRSALGGVQLVKQALGALGGGGEPHQVAIEGAQQVGVVRGCPSALQQAARHENVLQGAHQQLAALAHWQRAGRGIARAAEPGERARLV